MQQLWLPKASRSLQEAPTLLLKQQHGGFGMLELPSLSHTLQVLPILPQLQVCPLPPYPTNPNLKSPSHQVLGHPKPLELVIILNQKTNIEKPSKKKKKKKREKEKRPLEAYGIKPILWCPYLMFVFNDDVSKWSVNIIYAKLSPFNLLVFWSYLQLWMEFIYICGKMTEHTWMCGSYIWEY